MGVSANGVINNPHTDSKEVVVEAIYQSLSKNFSIPDFRVVKPDLSYFTFAFKDGGDERIMSLFFDCDRDYHQRGLMGRNIIFTVNLWGNAEEIIKQVAIDLQKKIGGGAYYQNDAEERLINLCGEAIDG